MIITLHGKAAHASNPCKGKNPAPTLSTLIAGLPALPDSLNASAADPNLMITVVFAELGQRAMGSAQALSIWRPRRCVLSRKPPNLTG